MGMQCSWCECSPLWWWWWWCECSVLGLGKKERSVRSDCSRRGVRYCSALYLAAMCWEWCRLTAMHSFLSWREKSWCRRFSCSSRSIFGLSLPLVREDSDSAFSSFWLDFFFHRPNLASILYRDAKSRGVGGFSVASDPFLVCLFPWCGRISTQRFPIFSRSNRTGCETIVIPIAWIFFVMLMYF